MIYQFCVKSRSDHFFRSLSSSAVGILHLFDGQIPNGREKMQGTNIQSHLYIVSVEFKLFKSMSYFQHSGSGQSIKYLYMFTQSLTHPDTLSVGRYQNRCLKIRRDTTHTLGFSKDLVL